MNLNYKKYVGYITAGLFGIALVIGLRGASAATQTSLPSSNVTPNFSGLNVSGLITAPQLNTEAIGDTGGDGIIDIEGGITVENPISNKFGDVVIDDDLKVTKKIDAQGGIINSNGDVNINDPLNVVNNGANIQGMLEAADITVSGDIDLSGDLQASKTIQADGELRAKGGIVNPKGDLLIKSPIKNPDADLIFKNKVVVNENLLVYGNIESNTGLTVNGISTFNGDINATASIKNTAVTNGLVTIAGPLKVTGDLNASSMQISGKAAFLGDTEIKNAYITGSLQNSAADGDFVRIDDQLDVRKGIFNNDTKLITFGSGSSPMNLNVTGASTLSGNVDIKGEISNSTPKPGTGSGLTQPVNIKDDLKVTGNITATSKIGKYTTSTKSITVSSQSSKTDSVSCASVEEMMSCDFFPTTKIVDQFKNIYINKSVPIKSTTGWKCDVTVTNKNASGVASQEISAYALCFNPTTN